MGYSNNQIKLESTIIGQRTTNQEQLKSASIQNSQNDHENPNFKLKSINWK